MAGITHTFESAVSQGTDANLIRRDDWNAEHTITLPTVMGTLHFETGKIYSTTDALSFVNGVALSTITLEHLQILNNLNHSGDYVGFFGADLVMQQEVVDLVAPESETAEEDKATVASVNTALGEITDKLNEALAALRLYGLLKE